jgi:HlyD family secretion protein
MLFPEKSFLRALDMSLAEAQFTQVRGDRGERAKLMYRVKLQLPVEVARKLAARLKAGMTGDGYVRLDPAKPWPATLALRGE